MNDMPPLLTIPEVARYLRVCEATVRRMIRDHSLASIKAGKSRRITQDELNRYMERNTT